MWTYLNENGESCTFSPAQEAASSEASCLASVPSALSKLIPTAGKCYCNGSETESSHDSRYGTTSEPSTEILGADKLMSLRADFLARTYHAPDAELESMESGADSGEKWPAWFAKWHRDSSSWKIPQCSLFEDLAESSPTWTRWGIMRGGECLELTTPEPVISESESLFWPTLNTEGWRSDGELSMLAKLLIPAQELASLTHRACASKKRRLLPTLTVCGNYNVKGASPTSGDGLYTALGGRPNPEWEEWFMGWPIGGAGLDPLETPKFQQWLRSHGVASEDQNKPVALPAE